jgi:predicted RNA-binding protein with PIN domain
VPILIDGHNLIGRMEGLSLTDPEDELKLVHRLIAYAARTGKQVTVVFDPGAGPGLAEKRRHGKVEVSFAPLGSSADAVIRRRVQAASDRQGWLVVTSDLELANAVRRAGARVGSSEEFAAELEAPRGGPAGSGDVRLTPDEVDAWLELFQRAQKPKSR